MKLLAALLLIVSGCAAKQPVTETQILYHAVECYDGDPVHGGMRVMRYGEGSECPDPDWFAEEWELLQVRLRIDDDDALAHTTLVYHTDGEPCGNSSYMGCWDKVKGGEVRESIIYVDQAHTVAAINFKRYTTWQATTWHEVCHALLHHYGYDATHDMRMSVIRTNGTAIGTQWEYTERDRYFFQKVCKGIGGEGPKIKKPLTERRPY